MGTKLEIELEMQILACGFSFLWYEPAIRSDSKRDAPGCEVMGTIFVNKYSDP
jgi:hypothetical protein